jgi:hypothetical protein
MIYIIIGKRVFIVGVTPEGDEPVPVETLEAVNGAYPYVAFTILNYCVRIICSKAVIEIIMSIGCRFVGLAK